MSRSGLRQIQHSPPYWEADLLLVSRKVSAGGASETTASVRKGSWDDMLEAEGQDAHIPSLFFPTESQAFWLFRIVAGAVRKATRTSPALGPHRVAVIDWAIGVLNAYKQKASVFFRAVEAVERFHNTSEPSFHELRISLCAALNLASKFESRRAVRLRTLAQLVAREGIAREDIVTRQFEMFARGQPFNRHTPVELIAATVDLLPLSGPNQRFVTDTSVTLMRMCCFDQAVWEAWEKADLVGCVVIFSVKLLSGLEPRWRADDAVGSLIRLFGLERSDLAGRLHALHDFVLRFETCHPGARNFRRVHQFSSLR